MAAAAESVSTIPGTEAGATGVQRSRIGQVVAAMAVSAAASLAFIAWCSFSSGGTRYFPLFDDAMISMRYARNFADGHGLVWNAGGPPVEGYSNFLWTLLMAGIHAVVPGDVLPSLAVMVLGAAILVALVAVTAALARELGPAHPQAPVVAAWLTALYPPLVFWTIRGMEVGLLALCMTTALVAALRLQRASSVRTAALLGLVLVTAVLTRDDATAPALLIALIVLLGTAGVGGRRIAFSVLAAVVAAVVLHLAWRWWYYHDIVPNTYHLKVGGTDVGTRLARGLGAAGLGVVVHLAVPLTLLAASLPVLRRPARPLVTVGLVVATHLLYSVYVGGDAWEEFGFANRYVTQAAPALLALTAVATCASRHVRRLRLASAFSLAAVTHVVLVAPALPAGLAPVHAPLVLLTPLAAATALGFLAARRGVGALAAVCVVGSALPALSWVPLGPPHVEIDRARIEYGVALAAAVPTDFVVAVVPAGHIPYYANRPSLDLLGKNDAHVATLEPTHPESPPGHTKRDYDFSIGQLKPHFVAQLYASTRRDEARLRRWGYRKVGLHAWTRESPGLETPEWRRLEAVTTP